MNLMTSNEVSSRSRTRKNSQSPATSSVAMLLIPMPSLTHTTSTDSPSYRWTHLRQECEVKCGDVIPVAFGHEPPRHLEGIGPGEERHEHCLLCGVIEHLADITP